MSVSELFYQSALINALIFLWLASLVSTTRILSRRNVKLSTALSLGTLFGPLALVFSWFTSADSSGHQKSIPARKWLFIDVRSSIAILVVSVLIDVLFYQFFVKDYQVVALSSELMIRNIAVFVMIAGFLGGIILSAITLRVAFFEACWATWLFSVLGLMLKNWAEEAFSYGSSTYFMTLMLTATMLLLLFLTLGGSLGYLFFGEGKPNFSFGYERFIGTRFLMTKRSSQMVSLITVISVIAVMIACSGMIVVMSVMNGFSSDLRAKILGANAHLMVLKYGKDFSEFDRVIEQTKRIPLVAGASAFIVNEGMVSSSRNLSGSIITGIDLEHVEESGRLQYVSDKALRYLKNPSEIPNVTEVGSLGDDQAKNELPGVIIGKEMASDLQVMVGDIVNLISPVGEIGPTGPIPRAKPFRVAGLFNSGMYDFDSKFAYIALQEAQNFFNLGDSVTGVEYRVSDIEQTRAVAKQIESVIGGYPFYTRDWMQMNRNMFSALQLEKIAMLIILSTYIFMASLLILVTLIMVVMEKGKEIAILKSMGATDVSIMKIFVTYGLFVGTLGAVLGGLFGFLVCMLIEKIGIRLDPDVYYFSNLPVKFESAEVFLVVSAAILISFLATIPPSLFAARLKPVEGLRYE
jgi:lipoprotein releasing system LolC/E family transmembrane protein